jgi:hypothetical protein
MAEPESTNTMFHGSFVGLGNDEYALRIASGGGGVDSPATSGPIAESGFGSGSVTAPAAGATIATHQPPASASGKLHQIVVTTWLSGSGTPGDGDNFNVAFKYGDTVISALPVAETPITTTFYFNAATGVAFSVVAVDAGTADVDYNAMLVATRVVS